MHILVFAPHPDDDILGCGGSISKHIKNGNFVTVVYMTNGDAGDLRYTKNEMADIRKKEAQRAADMLEIQETIFLNIHDGYIEYEMTILNKLIELIRQKTPDIVYLPDAQDAHRDHANTFVLVNEAIIRASANSYQEVKGKPWYVPTVLCYEVWTPLQNVSYIENISEYIKIKLHALQQHQSQLANVKYDAAIEGLNRYRGAMTGKGEYCECFKVMRIDAVSKNDTK